MPVDRQGGGEGPVVGAEFRALFDQADRLVDQIAGKRKVTIPLEPSIERYGVPGPLALGSINECLELGRDPCVKALIFDAPGM